MKQFKDNFSKQSETYLKYRPTYPGDLFEYLSKQTDGHELAWDCGTGNGQAALGLVPYYKKVYATDPSERQIENAIPHDKVVYKAEKAEKTGLKNNSVDLITVAQALHWFDFDKFYAEARRVLKKDGVLAAWTYGLPTISDEIDRTVQHFHDEILDDYWLYENRLVDLEYSTIPFPFSELPTPSFYIKKDLSFDDLLGLINSWSALQRYIRKNDHNPIEGLEKDLKRAWIDMDEKKEATWKITLKAGRV